MIATISLVLFLALLAGIIVDWIHIWWKGRGDA